MAPNGKSAPNLVLGAASVGDASVDPMARFDTPEQVNAFLQAFAKRGYRQLDTSHLYSPQAPGTSEPRLGAVSAGDTFIIDTKVSGGWDGGKHTKQNVLRDINVSLGALKVPQINIQYLHAPDRTTPFEEACEAMDQAHKEGKIKKWGLSNYTAGDVQQFIKICEERGFVKPSVYQGHYNAVVRSSEAELFPVLRKNGMAFYAYSPSAGGLFAGNHKEVKSGGRWDSSTTAASVYAQMYLQPPILAAADKALAVVSKHGIGGHATALRWAVHHSILSSEHGDSVLIGASSLEQLESNLDMVEQGPLPDEVVAAMDAMYKEIGNAVSYHAE